MASTTDTYNRPVRKRAVKGPTEHRARVDYYQTNAESDSGSTSTAPDSSSDAADGEDSDYKDDSGRNPVHFGAGSEAKENAACNFSDSSSSGSEYEEPEPQTRKRKPLKSSSHKRKSLVLRLSLPPAKTSLEARKKLKSEQVQGKDTLPATSARPAPPTCSQSRHIEAPESLSKNPEKNLTKPSPLARSTASPKRSMAPGYRANAQSRRTNRGNVDHHDVLDGIPVRHWRRDYVTVAPQAAQENTTSQNDIWAVELPHGMPKDFHLLPQHSQDLLRAARSGKIYKRSAPVEEEEADTEIVGEKTDKKEDDPRDKGFVARAWKQVPRNQEGPSVDYLAKRRKGLVTAGTRAPNVDAPIVMKATVRRTDEAGNTYVQDMVVSNGEKVEGEVLAKTLIPDPHAPIAPAEPQPSPVRRKPIKRKLKGPGRGRKKKIEPPTSVPTPMQGDGLAHTVEGAGGAVGQDGIKVESDNGSTSAVNEDTEMGDDSNMASDDEDGEGGDEGDEEEEGTPEIQNSPTKSQQTLSPIPDIQPNIQPIPALQPDIDMSSADLDTARPPSLERLKTEGAKSGSPLKNVALTTSNLNSPIVSPTAASSESVPPANTASIQEAPEETSMDTGPKALPSPPPQPTEAHEASAANLLAEEEVEEKMLLDNNEIFNDILIKADVVPDNVNGTPVVSTEAIPSIQEIPHIADENVAATKSTTPTDDAVKEPSVDDRNAKEAEEEFPDLLGNLERQLDG